MKNILEYIVVIFFFWLFKILGLKLSSFLGGLLLSVYGFFSKRNSVAKKNILRVFPKISRHEINSIISKMWFHFGRVVGAKMGPSWHQVASKIDLQIDQKLVAFWSALGIGF